MKIKRKKTFKEGVKIDLEDPKSVETTRLKDIKVDPRSDIPGEHLSNIAGEKVTGGVRVLWSLDPGKRPDDPTFVKPAMDFIKYRFHEVKDELDPIFERAASRIKSIFTPNLILYLGSADPASGGVANMLAKHFGEVRVAELPKTHFEDVHMMVNWSSFLKRSGQRHLDPEVKKLGVGNSDDYQDDEVDGRFDQEKFYKWLQSTKPRVEFDTAREVDLEKLNKIFDKAKEGTDKVLVFSPSEKKSGKVRSNATVKDATEALEVLQNQADPSGSVKVYFEPKFYVISKSIGAPIHRMLLHTKYSIDPNKEYYTSLDDYINQRNGKKINNPSGQIIFDEILRDKLNILIVDDNIQSGKDMLDVIKELKRIWIELHSKEDSSGDKLKAVETLQSILRSKTPYQELKRVKGITKEFLGVDMDKMGEEFFYKTNQPKRMKERLEEKKAEVMRETQVYSGGKKTLEESVVGYVLYRVGNLG
jgi:hypothetical protein